MSNAVIVSNIAPGTSDEKVREFFNFCGKVTNLEIENGTDSRTAKVTFEKSAAVDTALLLDNTQLGPSSVHVERAEPAPTTTTSTLPDSTPSSPTQNPDDPSIPQEVKPKSRIIAEYLAQGYMFSDSAIEKAIALDKKHGFSTKFLSALESFDKKYAAANKAKALDDKYSVSRQATSGYNSLHSYFEKAMDTPTGRKLRDFYQQTEKNVLDIHSEARRLQREKKEAAEGEKQQTQPQAESEPQLQKEGEKQTDVKVGEK